MGRVTLPQHVNFYTVEEISKHLRISKMTIYRMVHDGEIPSRRYGRAFRIPVQEFHEWEKKEGVWESSTPSSPE